MCKLVRQSTRAINRIMLVTCTRITPLSVKTCSISQKGMELSHVDTFNPDTGFILQRHGNAVHLKIYEVHRVASAALKLC
jgi:hypothetical protein